MPAKCAGWLLASLGLLAWGTPQSAWGDTFHLDSGGRIVGESLQKGDAGRQVAIRVSPAIVVVLREAQLRDVVHESPHLAEYRRLAPAAADTVADQWRVAEWCRKKRLDEQRRWHLERVVMHDSQHAPARRALGYSQVNGEWIHPDQHRKSRGYVYYRGKWRLAQEIELLEAQSKRQAAEDLWRSRIARWRRALDSEKRNEALNQLLAIREEHAAPALAERLAGDASPAARLIYVEALANIGTLAAAESLWAASLSDQDEEVFYALADAIVRLRSEGACGYFIRALADKDNVRVNRAAVMLGRLGDESAIGPLIDSLVTTHRFQTAPAGGGVSTAAFARGGDFAPQGARLESAPAGANFEHPVENPAVLAALVKLTGKNFGYDEQTWRAWQSRLQAAELSEPAR